ncbi:FAD-dependent oxidoreductase [Ferrimicrobium acidiphilum]|uniref:FAD-dependent oxidoreductase n=1 Tax=Ferrimicrobium acidiphilum TaxID=121039 RepID=UPI0023EFC1FB|nr:FAD-dependent oxidoreductase [Ferrimicrobium acidiphilum]MCL5052967.1 FAD-dependent oxidoreductase [Gammaproteobacteria bacterium]
MRVVVIGAGATGLGVAWDLTLRGIDVTVVEARELGAGTSGRFHGLLHSGGRYLVTDPSAAKECYSENMLLRRIACDAVVATGGYFVKKFGDDSTFESRWLSQAEELGVPTHPVKVAELVDELPMLTRDIQRAHWVPDGVLEGFTMLSMLVQAIESRGSRLFDHTKAIRLRLDGDRVSGVEVEGVGGYRVLECDAVVNTAGPWAGIVARDWGLDIKVQPSYGLMLIFANRRMNKVVNRLKPPGDGDIFVPHREVVILGTTDVAQGLPDAPEPRRAEAIRLMELGAELVPDLGSWRVLRGFTGVRPLYEPSGVTGDSRTVSRDFAVLDHGETDGLNGAFSVLGGKWTTFRLMGEALGERLAKALNVDSPSLSREVAIERRHVRSVPSAPKARGALLCECEQVYEADLDESTATSQMQRRFDTWFAMGPCQGTFCAHRVLGRERAVGFADELSSLRREREHGLNAVGWGASARLIALEQSIAAQSLGEDAR